MLGEQLETAVGPERVALPGEHPRRVLPLPLEGEHPGGEREVARQVLLPQEPQQFPVVGVPRQRHPRDPAPGQGLAGQLGPRLAVAGHLLLARVRLHHGRPALEQPGAGVTEVLPGVAGQRGHGRGRRPGLVTGGGQLRADFGQPLQAPRRRHLPGGLRVVAADRRGDLGQICDTGRGDDRRRAGGRAAHRGRQHSFGQVQPMPGQQPVHVLVQRGDAVVVEGGGAGAEDGHVLRPRAERLPVADQLAGHVPEGVGGTAPVELVDRDGVGEVQHLDLFQLGRRAELGGHHVQRDVSQRNDPRVALPDPGRLQDHQVISRRLAGADDGLDILRQLVGPPGGQRPEKQVVPVEGVHPDPVTQQRAAGPPPGRVDREHGHPQLVLLVGAQPADQLVGQRGLARAARSGDPEHGHPPGHRGGGQRGTVRLRHTAALQAGDRPGQGPPFAGQHGLDRGRAVRQVGVAVPDELVDHSGQAEPLAVFGGEDPDPGRGQPRDLVRDDDPAAATVDPHVPGPGLGQQLRQILEVLDVPALVGADRDALRVLLQHRVDHRADRPVVPEVHDFGALRLQDAAHDVDRGVVPVEQRRRRDEPHRVHRDVQLPPLLRNCHRSSYAGERPRPARRPTNSWTANIWTLK